MVNPTRGNFVSEWFGYRTFPNVARSNDGLSVQRRAECPFLTRELGVAASCIKPESSRGVCTINSASNGIRQDWLVCPFRALGTGLEERVTRLIFGLASSDNLLLFPAPRLADTDAREQVVSHLSTGGRVVVYLQDKLGGEISVLPTSRSPEFAFDTTLVELHLDDASITLGQFGVLELQTMDFHGSYRAAVRNLEDSLRLHGDSFPDELGRNPQWLSQRIEGPNIANVFKRTFYQLMVKFQVALHPHGAAAAIAIPQSVWDSWQRHLGAPTIQTDPNGISLIDPSDATRPDAGWIIVFDMDNEAGVDPNPLRITTTIRVSSDTLATHALKSAPREAFTDAENSVRLLTSIARRLALFWPDLEFRTPPDPRPAS